MTELRERQVGVESVSIHVVEAGDSKNGSIVFLHGWPENWSAFEQTMLQLADSKHVVAIDLPGIGWSEGKVASHDKLTLARYVRGTIAALGLSHVTLVGHDAGGQIAYAYLRAYPGELEAAVIMNVAVPGVEPWSKVMNDPKRWHFAFHSVPGLPEKLVTPEIAEYFDHFFDALEGPKRVSAEQRKQFVEAYSRPSALQTGFEWHRAFEQDAKDNVALQGQRVKTRVLYVRGECEPVDVDEYLEGFKAAGIEHIDAAVIPNAGHFVPSEQPQELAALIRQFTDRRKRLG